MAMLTAQITRVLTESSTILVVAVSSLVTEIPAKLKNAIDITVPVKKLYYKKKVQRLLTACMYVTKLQTIETMRHPCDTFRMTFRMTLRMTFKKWDFKGVFRDDFEGDLEGYFKVSYRGLGGLGGGLLRGLQIGIGRALVVRSGQVRSGSVLIL